MISGAKPVSYHLQEGRVYLQQWNLEGYIIQYIQSQLNQKIIFEMRHLGEAEILVCSLKARLEINSFSNPLVRLNPEYAHLYVQPNFEAFCILRGTKRISSLLLITHPVSELSKQTADQNSSFHPFLMEARMIEMIERVIYTSYTGQKHFHLKQILDLMAIGRESASAFKNTVHFSDGDLTGLYAIREWLDKNTEKKYSEHTMIQQAGMNIRKLNKGFSNLFGQTPYHYLRLKRLKVAHEKIMETNTNLKTISKDACYRNYTNFSSAFKKHFGYSPVSLRIKESQ